MPTRPAVRSVRVRNEKGELAFVPVSAPAIIVKEFSMTAGPDDPKTSDKNFSKDSRESVLGKPGQPGLGGAAPFTPPTPVPATPPAPGMPPKPPLPASTVGMGTTHSSTPSAAARDVANEVKAKAGDAADDLKKKADAAAEDMKKKAAVTAEDVKKKAGDVYEDAKESAVSIASDLKHQASDLAQDAKDKAYGVVSDVSGRVREVAEEQKAAGADTIGGVARAVGSAADELEGSAPGVARYVRDAASSIDRVSRDLRDRPIGDIVGSLNDFARRQPVAFFAGAVLAGFALSRFLKSSAERDGDDRGPLPAPRPVGERYDRPLPYRDDRPASTGTRYASASTSTYPGPAERSGARPGGTSDFDTRGKFGDPRYGLDKTTGPGAGESTTGVGANTFPTRK